MASRPVNDAPARLLDDVSFGDGVVVGPFTNLYGCEIGDETRIGPFVEIQRGVRIGARCKVQSHTFVCEGVMIEDEVFVGHGVLFVNEVGAAADQIPYRGGGPALNDLVAGHADLSCLSAAAQERDQALGRRDPRQQDHGAVDVYGSSASGPGGRNR